MSAPNTNAQNLKADWIAVDWGTTSLRCWAMHGTQLIASAQSPMGMSQVAAGRFEQTLLALVEPWLQANTCTPVLACGMVGAKQGWIEAPYQPTPCSAHSQVGLITAPTADPRINVRIIAGVSQASPADVMRGEETLIAGLLTNAPTYNGVVCMPGTHCKWVEVRNATLQRFNTVLTGELFELLSTQSVLRFDTQLDGNEKSLNNDVFISAVQEHAATPDQLTATLFSIRAQSLLNNNTTMDSTSRLSGLLIAADVIAMQHYWQDKPITIVAEAQLASLYKLAITTLNPEAYISITKMDALALSGLCLLAKQLGVINATS